MRDYSNLAERRVLKTRKYQFESDVAHHLIFSTINFYIYRFFCYIFLPITYINSRHECGKEFLWTAQKQQTFYSNQSRKRYKNSSTKPFCSKSCSGKYGKQVQETLCKENKNKHIDIDVFLNGKLVDTFDCIEKCSQLLQYEFDLNKYRANEYVKRVLSGERQQYKGYVFKYHN